MRFATYNIRHTQGIDGVMSVPRIAKTIASLDADVVGLTEVWGLGGRVANSRPGRMLAQAERLGEALGMERAYLAAHSWGPLSIGNAILTRGQILDLTPLLLPKARERRGCLVGDILLDDVRFRFAVTHLSISRPVREAQFDMLVDQLPGGLPLVLTGDLNTGRDGLGRLLERFRPTPDSPATFPSPWPRLALDHFLFDERWRFRSLSTPRTLASDHLPLVVELEPA